MILEYDTFRDQFIALFVKLQKWDRLNLNFLSTGAGICSPC
jgi:hypothetical protein